MILSLLSFKLSVIKKFFETRATAKIITLFLFCSVFFFVVIGLYFFLLTGLRFAFFQTTDDTRNALIYFLYESFYLILFLLTALSTVVSLVFSFFRGKKEMWLMASPGYKIIAYLALLKLFLTTLFPTLILFAPLSFALSKIVHIPVTQLASLYLSFILLILCTISMLAIFILSIASIVRTVKQIIWKKVLSFREFLISFIILCALCIWYGISSLTHIDLPTLFNVNKASEILETKDIGEHFYLTPSHLSATHALCVTIQFKDTLCKNSPLFTLLYVTLLSLLVFAFIARLHFSLWKQFQDNPSESQKAKLIPKNRFFEQGPEKALLEREHLGLTRDLKGLFWLLFFIALWGAEILVYTIAKGTYIKHGVSFEEYLPRVVSIQYMVALYFVSALTLRFVYPSFGVEKNMKWILFTTPLTYRKRYSTKLFFFVTLFVSLGIAMTLLSAFSLSFSPLMITSCLLMLVPALMLIVSFGLTLGAFYGNDSGEDAETATTSMPGLFFTALTLLYGGIGSFLLYQSITKNIFSYLFIYSIGSIIIGIILTYTSIKKLK